MGVPLPPFLPIGTLTLNVWSDLLGSFSFTIAYLSPRYSPFPKHLRKVAVILGPEMNPLQ